VKIQEGGGGRTSETPENGRNRRSRVSRRTDIDLINGHEGEERSKGLIGRVDDGHVVHASGKTEEGDWSEKVTGQLRREKRGEKGYCAPV
jgi:hypothetical protein